MKREQNDLASGWSFATLGEISEIKYGKGLPTKNLKGTGYPVFGANGIIGFFSQYLYEEEQVLISCRGAYSGKINISPPKCYVTNNSLAIEFCPALNETKKFFYYILKAVDKSKLVTGTAQPQVTINNAVVLPIPLPPIPEQRRIVVKIEELFTRLDAGVEVLKQVQVQLKRYRQSVLKAAVEGKLTAEWREKHKDELEPADKLLKRIQAERKEKLGKKYKEPMPPDTKDLPELPEGWVWVSLESISDALGGFAFKSKDYKQYGYQIVKIGNVKMNKIDLNKSPSFVDNQSPEVIEKYSLREHDILITLTGTRRKRDYGFVAIVKSERNLLLNQRVGRLRFCSEVNPNYYLIALQSEEFRDRLFAKETGNVGQGNIGMGAITEEAIPLPPLSEQERIFSECEKLLSVIDKTELILSFELQRSQSLRQSILKRTFEGKLVPQDPTDEPATILLERIKAEKAEPKKSKQLRVL